MTAARCTGVCCRDIVLDVAHRDVRRAAYLGHRESATILRLMHLDRVVNGVEVHRCQALQETGCWLRRDERPAICTGYPSVTPCPHCFARSDAEARGVALAVRP